MNYPTCGEISCEECNDRYEKAMDRIAELEAMVREVLNNWFISGEAREKALALLEDQVSELTKVYVRKPRYVQWMTDAILGAM